MKRILLFFLAFILYGISVAQNITAMEYFFDADPGAGLGTSLSLTAATSINNTYDINISSLTDGFHTISVRAKDENNMWSTTFTSPFYKLPATVLAAAPNITKLEYFIDGDLGAGNGTDVPVTAGTSITNQIVNIPLTSVADGFHTLSFRTQDANGKWSTTFTSPFYKLPATVLAAAPNITKLEYFIDGDLGAGNGTDVPVTAGTSITNQIVSIPLTSVADGFHTLSFRTQDANGKWSTTFTSPFYKIPASATASVPNLSKLEYFIDNDPGAGAGTPIILSSGTSITDYIIDVPVTSQTVGTHLISVRAQDANNKWSIVYYSSFTMLGPEPTAQPTSLAFSNIQATTMTVSWTAATGSPTGYIVLRKTASSPTDVPVDATNYAVGNPIGTSTVAYVGNAVTFNETLLSESTTYYYDIFTYSGTTGMYNYLTTSPLEKSQITADVTAPIVTTYSPADNATGVAVNANLVLTFSEAIQKGTGNILIKEGGITTQTIAVTNASVSVSGNTVTINPADFASSAAVNIEIASGVFKDLSNNNYAGITNATTWNFTVADVVAPTVNSYSPVDNATGVAVNSNLVLTFQENVAKGTTGNILIKEGGVTTQTIGVTSSNVTVSGNTVTIDPTDFTSSAAVNIEIAAGAIKDIAGNSYSGISNTTIWNFTVADVNPPLVTSYSPLDNATGVAVNSNLVLTFVENVQKGTTGNIVIKEGGSVTQTIAVTDAAVTVSGTTVTINPALDFSSSAAVSIEIAAVAIKDLSNNNYAGITNATIWNFTTAADLSPPLVSTYSPADNATNVAVSSNLVLTFGENVQVGTGNILIKENGTTTQTIAVTDNTKVSISGNIVTINPSDFSSSAAVTIEIQAGAFKDLANNNYAGITDATTWNFTVADINAPIVNTYSPADEAISVAVNSNLVLTFNENIQKGTGDIFIKEGGTTTQTIAVTNAAVTVSGTTVTINPASNFSSSALVTVEITAGAIKDMSNNNYAGIADAVTWNFTSADVNAPIINSYSPLDEASNVSKSSNLVLTFDENIQKGSGSIIIKEGGTTTQTIPVANVSVSGNEITIDPADFTLGVLITIEMSAGVFKDLSNNNFTGSSTWNFTVASDGTPPSITDNTLATANSGSDVIITATITDLESSITSASVEWRSISTGGATTTQTLTKSGDTYSRTIPNTEVGFLGLEYIISATSTGGISTTGATFNIVKINSPNGVTIPYSSFGSSISNYRIIAVPLTLTNNKVSDVFEELMPEDNEKWRMFHYEPDATPTKTQPLTGTSTIVPGKGYWLITRDNPGTINSGPGVSVTATTAEPFEITLKNGWNQIGNPYNFNLVWADVQDANPGLPVLRIFNGSITMVDGTRLDKMTGAFVKVNSQQTLKFPVKKNPASGGRGGEDKIPFLNQLTDPAWQVLLNVRQGDQVNTISGFGMNQQAREHFDQYDGFNMPRFFDSYLELNHNKKEGDDFYSKDIVPTAEQHVWEFFVESTLSENLIRLEWDNSYFGENEKELYLWDVSEQRGVDMRTVSNYSFNKNSSKEFKVIFGARDFIKEKTAVNELVLHSIFPNPADNELTIPFTLPESASTQSVHFSMTDVMGRKCWDTQGEYGSGYREATWKRMKGEAGGIYFISIKSGSTVRLARVVLK